MGPAEHPRVDNSNSTGAGRLWYAATLVLGVGCALWTGIQAGGADYPTLPPSLFGPGGWGAALWETLQSLLGQSAGPLAFRCLAAVLLLGPPIWFGGRSWLAGGFPGSRRIALLTLLAACALLPLGSDALLVPLAAGCTLLPLAPAVALAWLSPFFSPLAFWGAVAASLLRSERGEGTKGLLTIVAAVASPAGILAFWHGEAFAPFAAALLNDPWSGWTAGPAWAWALPLWLVWVGFDQTEGLRGSFVRGGLRLLGLLARPLMGLGALSCATVANTPVSAPTLLSLAGAVSLGMFLVHPPTPPPAGAREALRTVPPSEVVLVEPRWSRALERDLPQGVQLQPSHRGWEGWRELREGLGQPAVPPFADRPLPKASRILLSPKYPAFAAPRPYGEGWRLVAATREAAFFAKDGGPPAAWDPFQPLPSEESARRNAWSEVARVARQDNRFFEALRDAGRLSLDFGTGEEALEWLQAALKLHPKDAALMSDVGSAYHRLGKGKEAEDYYLASIRENPQELLPRMNLAGLYIGAGQGENAEMVLKDLIARRPGFLPAYRMLIPLYLQANRTAEAIATAQSIPPDSRSPEEESLARATPVPQEVVP